MPNNNHNHNDEIETPKETMMMAFCIAHPGDQVGQVMQIPKPSPEAGFALVRVLRAGVCNTDLEILQGYMGFTGVLGHEFVGVVEDVNDDSASFKEKWMGQRVCGDINVGCGDCRVCLNTDQLDSSCGCSMMSRNHCPNRTVLGTLKRNGTMAEYLTLPLSNLHLVPPEVPDEVAVFAEPLAAACRIPEQGLIRYSPKRPDKVAILGDGKLGLMIAEVLGREYSSACQQQQQDNSDNYPPPVLFGKHPHKLDLVKHSSGVECKLVSECQDASAFNGVAAAHAGQYDVVVDATGSPAGLSLAAGLCRPMGTLVRSGV